MRRDGNVADLCREQAPRLYDQVLEYADDPQAWLYIGSNPGRMIHAVPALKPWLTNGNPMVLDASALQFDTMIDRMIRGGSHPFIREANRNHGDRIPCIAR